MTDHEHDAEGNCIVPQGTVVLPCWRFSLWDVAGIALHTAGGLLAVIGDGLRLLSQECSASANFARQNYDLRKAYEQEEAARQQMAADLRGLIGEGDPS